MGAGRRNVGALVAAALVGGVPLAGCAPTIGDLNLRPAKYHQERIRIRARVARLERVGDAAVLELESPDGRRMLVRTTGPLEVSVDDWVRATGVFVPEARVGEQTLYDVLVADEVERTRRPWLPGNLM